MCVCVHVRVRVRVRVRGGGGGGKGNIHFGNCYFFKFFMVQLHKYSLWCVLQE